MRFKTFEEFRTAPKPETPKTGKETEREKQEKEVSVPGTVKNKDGSVTISGWDTY